VPQFQVWQWLWWGAALLGIVAAVLALRMPRLRPAFPWIAVAAVALDLALLGVRYHPVLPAAYDLSPPAALRFLIEEERRTPEPFRVLAEFGDLLPNLGAYYGLWDVRANDPMQPAAPAFAVGRSFAPDFRVGQLVQIYHWRFPHHLDSRFGELGVRYVLTRHGRQLQRPWRLVFNGVGGKVWKNPDPLPLFSIPAAIPAALHRQEGGVRIARVQPNGFDLDVLTRTGGLVVSSVSYSRGWRVQWDGIERKVRQVNGGFAGFEVPPGRHQVVLDYRPASWTWGVRLFFLGLAGILYSALSTSIGRRSRARALAASPAPTASTTAPPSATATGQA